jgi:NitT/TauT family transport system permease protein
VADTTQMLHRDQILSQDAAKLLQLIFWRIALAVFLWAVWQQLAGHLGPDTLPQPSEVFRRLWAIIKSGEIVHMTFVTMAEVAGGLLVGGGLGIFLPFLLSLSPRATRAIEPFLKIAMGIPKLALSPIIILWFGVGFSSKVALIALMVFFMIFVSTFAGIRSVDGKLLMMCRILGARPVQLLKEVVWNTALPFIFAALKTALPWAINAAIVAEFLASEAGLGYYIHHSYNSADTVGAFAGVLAVTLIMVIIDILFVAIQARSLLWRAVDTQAIH